MKRKNKNKKQKKKCPDCLNLLFKANDGREICSICGWSNQKTLGEKEYDINKKRY